MKERQGPVLSAVARLPRAALVVFAIHALHCGSQDQTAAPAGFAGLAGSAGEAEGWEGMAGAADHAGSAGGRAGAAGRTGTVTDPGAGAGHESGSAGNGGDAWISVDPGLDGSVDTDGGCRRDVSLAAVTLTKPESFDLVIVADHSDSLAWSREELSAGLKDLLADVQGRDVRVFLLTPTQYGASSAQAQRPMSGDSVVAWQDPKTGNPYSNAMTTYTQSCTDPSSGATISCPDPKGSTPYKAQGTWQFNMPGPIAQITPDMTDAQFESAQKAVSDAILALGGTGSPNEQPLCTLSRYVTQPKTSLPKNVVFLILSDEDDVSLPGDCLVSYTAELKNVASSSSATQCYADCDAYRYSMTGEMGYTTFPFTCSAVDDLGNTIAGTETPSTAYQQDKACDKANEGPCTAAESAQMAVFCTGGKKVVSCDRRCLTSAITCSVDLSDDGIDACTHAFTKGTTYESLAKYCTATFTGGSNWHDCTSQGLYLQASTSLSGSSVPGRLMEGSKTGDVGAYFTRKAKEVFSSGKYMTEAIVFDPAFECTLGKGQSYATNISAVVGETSHRFPLCEPYAPALAGVSGFAQELVQTQFPVTMKSDEQITAVVVEAKDGSKRTLSAAQFRYDSSTHTLTVNSPTLRATDAMLRVEITSACRPPIH